MLYSPDFDHDSCGVGLITHKRSVQTHDILQLADQALCKVPHRGGINAEGVGDGGGACFDLSVRFYSELTGESLKGGEFAIGNFFFPKKTEHRKAALLVLNTILADNALSVILRRDVPVDNSVLNKAGTQAQLPIEQWIIRRPNHCQTWEEFEWLLNTVLLEIEEKAVNENPYPGFYPLSFSSRTQVYKGRLNAWEVISYFRDLKDPRHEVSMLFFHTRFSTNTAPSPLFAQPFRHLAHNGELNTDRKSRISELAVASHEGYKLAFPPGQSDSARLDQTLTRRLVADRQPIEEIIIKMMPPAWENDNRYSQKVRDMLAYFALSEEKNDGPAGLVFCDGVRIGAALDRLGLRPLRTLETDDYFVVSSEAGQIDFPPETVTHRGRIRAGGMIVFDHSTHTISRARNILARLADEKDYGALLEKARINFKDLEKPSLDSLEDTQAFSYTARHIAYGLNQESFKFMLDPMMETGAERVSAMGYGIAPNAMNRVEGGMSRYFTQRFAQVTNPPLDSIREADGMTLRVSLGPKPHYVSQETLQLQLESPILLPDELAAIRQAGELGTFSVVTIETLYPIDTNAEKNGQALHQAIESVCEQVIALAKADTDIIILDDANISPEYAAIPAPLLSAAVNRRLIDEGQRFKVSFIYATGQICSSHDVALILGFGASAVSPHTVYNRAREMYAPEAVMKVMQAFRKAAHKALMKTMGKFGLCTVESYIGGAFFESAFLDTEDERLRPYFPNTRSPIGGAGFEDIATSSYEWHRSAVQYHQGEDVPLLGLFKERSDGAAGHSFGVAAVRGFGEMTAEPISFANERSEEGERLHILPQDDSYLSKSRAVRTPQEIDAHQMTPAYREFLVEMEAERAQRPAALRDVLALPVDFNQSRTAEEFLALLKNYRSEANIHSACRGLKKIKEADGYVLVLAQASEARYEALKDALSMRFGNEIEFKEHRDHGVFIQASGAAERFFDSIMTSPRAIALEDVQPAHEITATFATGAMSHGALLEKAHEAVAMGINMVGGISNSGEGGENSRRFNTIRASKVKQIASGRFGVWAGYLADPMLEELEIKIAQGAKPGEGGQLPARKVTVEIAAARGGTPGVELVSPPPHHDTYSIEDLAQLIHDCKAARVKVIVKLVSTEGIGTIAVGVAKAGADVINVAGNTGGTGAAQVTSLKHAGRIPELGLAEVHQALSANGLRDKVILRCSGAHQTGLDVIKSCLLGGDSFEFGTTALMMLKCVMAKNCNIKCPVGLTTPHEVFDGDPRALAQYFMNVAVEVREWLAKLGFKSLREMRGHADLLHLIDHESLVGHYRMDSFLRYIEEVDVEDPVYLEAKFEVDDGLWKQFNRDFDTLQNDEFLLMDVGELRNFHKSVGGQFSVDIERYLNYQIHPEDADAHSKILTLANGRRVLEADSIVVSSENSAGQSFGAFTNSGVVLIHQGTCNDGVGKSMCGGRIVVQNPGGGGMEEDGNVLLGNFALFGATGGELFVQGGAGDRFGVRNSGAVAVVEGVGDFACEYMTNGTVINLGGYGKGFGNGMSGGVAYQYDPSGEIVERCAQEDVCVYRLDAENALSQAQETALLWHLNRHQTFTDSQKVINLLENWQTTRTHFYYLIPKAWEINHRAENILQHTHRKAMIEELSQAIAWRLVREANQQYNGAKLRNGHSPSYGINNLLAEDLIVATGTLHRAMCAVAERGVNDIEYAAKRLLANEDRPLTDQIKSDAQKALADYSDEQLAMLLAAQRLEDYRRALSLRESFDSYALGTSAWILHCAQENKRALSSFKPLSQALAEQFSAVMAESLYQLAQSA
ncbi:glutamate synthase-related protein [Suttonella ornithocola]